MNKIYLIFDTKTQQRASRKYSSFKKNKTEPKYLTRVFVLFSYLQMSLDRVIVPWTHMRGSNELR